MNWTITTKKNEFSNNECNNIPNREIWGEQIFVLAKFYVQSLTTVNNTFVRLARIHISKYINSIALLMCITIGTNTMVTNQLITAISTLKI